MQSQTHTHASLLARLGDANTNTGAAWADFVDRYGELMRGFCRRYDLQPSDQDDVLQDVLLGLTRSMPGFRYDPAAGKFRSYLKTVVLHAIYRKLCQKSPQGGLEGVDAASQAATASGDPATDATWEQEWRRHHLRQAMRVIESEFSARDLGAFERYAIAGEGAEHVASELGLTTEALYQIKSRVTRRLAALIEAQVRDEG